MDPKATLRFPGNLDPRAEEFRPRNSQTTLVPPLIYYPYPSSPFPVNPLLYDEVGSGCSIGTSVVNGLHPLSPLPPPSSAPTRALLLSSVPGEATEEIIRREIECFGEIRGVQMEWVQDGMVTVQFYDLRHAETALVEIREQHMQQQSRLRQHYCFLLNVMNFRPTTVPVPSLGFGRGLICGRAIWAQFVFPVANSLANVLDAQNHGSIVIFNLDSGISASKLNEIFQKFGPIKEVRETPTKRNQRFVEFFDMRDAARAIKEMDGKEINGKKVLIEFSRPGGHRRFTTSSTTHPTPTINYGSNFYSSHPPQPRRSFSRSASDASSNSSPNNKKPSFRSGNHFTNRRRSKSLVDDVAAVKNLKKSSGINCSSETKDQQQEGMKQQPRSKSWKGRHKMFPDTQFLIKEDAIFKSTNCRKDTRTTVMIKNIPNKYSQKLLLNMLDNHCIHCNEQIGDGVDDQPLSSYDFVYLPIDFNNKCNVGYGFVNLTSPEATWRLYKAFHMQHWEVFNSRKICQISYARLQGLEALKEHFQNSKFACETDDYFPVVFAPPRDGKQLTDPVPIGGHTNAVSEPLTITNKVDNGNYGKHDDDEDDDEDNVGSETSTITFEEATVATQLNGT
ncbi:hypothetical protein IFM89_021436 [Coptis chinensis]|uniref:RRM domain-containing protein n=1 Tax=Coptis chinensis TaxID=261450 RepID=A0A835HVH2_9MAGN|nr:hypothetical protein IFM89_021436 [Coptis chinensis]